MGRIHANAQLLERFYTSFASLEPAGMWECYKPDARFSDGIFQELHGTKIRDMWQMLCERATDLEVSFSNISADDVDGRANWEARYTFAATGRPVRNSVKSSFRFSDGLIIDHRDSFSVWRWLSMSMGRKGAMLGWSPPARARARNVAKQALDAYGDDRRPGF